MCIRDRDSTIPPHVLELATWASRYYRAPESLLRRSLLPPDARRQTRRHIIPIPDPDRAIGLFDAVATMGPLEDRIWASLPPDGLSLPGLRSTWGRETEAAIRKLKRQKRIRVEEREIAHRKPALPLRACPGFEDDLKRAPRQLALWLQLQAQSPKAVSRTKLLLADPGAQRTINALLARGAIVEATEEELTQTPEPGPTLNLSLIHI